VAEGLKGKESMGIKQEYSRAGARLLAHVENGTTDWGPGVRRVPVDDYLNADRWQREMEQIFRRQPLLLALSIELPEKGSFKTMEVAGRPVLMTRGKDGVVRAFLNVCSHRQALVVEQACGTAGRFTCPYHGWTFAQDGRLIGLADRQKFGEVDASGLGLVALPCAERAGMVFVTLTPDAPFDLDGFLAGFRPDLEWLGFETWYHHRTNVIRGACWKVVTDGFLEGYHFAAAHPETIHASTKSNVMTYDFFGPHQRVGFARQNILEMKGTPEDEMWRSEGAHFGFVRFVFPNVAFSLGRNGGGTFTQIVPGARPEETVAYQHLIFPKTPQNDAEYAECERVADFYKEVVTREDFELGFRIQKGLESGAYEHMTFGRNEWGNQHHHASIDSYVLDPAPLRKVG
jgi:phenylpropionate dioxygenase-like ring-hydroxylating dioxygenase large terminal subunit